MRDSKNQKIRLTKSENQKRKIRKSGSESRKPPPNPRILHRRPPNHAAKRLDGSSGTKTRGKALKADSKSVSRRSPVAEAGPLPGPVPGAWAVPKNVCSVGTPAGPGLPLDFEQRAPPCASGGPEPTVARHLPLPWASGGPEPMVAGHLPLPWASGGTEPTVAADLSLAFRDIATKRP